jgi:hypothetical protein
MKRLLIFLTALIIIVLVVAPSGVFFRKTEDRSFVNNKSTWWDIQSIDSMKYSRDLAREMANNKSFDTVIDTQVRLIAGTGATHISIGTPYAEEFLPFLKKWVSAARKYGLNVWFRGNIPGWEGWFDYAKINRKEHASMVQTFILANGDLFEEGDIFSSCPECENGGPGDPRRTGDIEGHRNFLIEEYKITNEAFRKIGKNVRSNFAPMNGDVANLIMDKDTTRALGGIVVIDHYVSSETKLIADIQNIAEKSGGKIILGEFGAPIPDIHGNLNSEEQAVLIESLLSALSKNSNLSGINYWTAFGGSTRLWENDFTVRPAVNVISKYYKPTLINGRVLNEAGDGVKDAKVSSGKSVITEDNGYFNIPIVYNKENLLVEASLYHQFTISVEKDQKPEVILVLKHENLFFKLRKLLFKILRTT